MKGKFITIEGVEGAGKTTQAKEIARFLRCTGTSLVTTREPGGTPLGEGLRTLVLEHRQESMTTDAELLLMFAARAEHIHQVIQPALQRGFWVLCDRFTDATYAYQGGGRGVPWDRITRLETWVQGSLRPDLTLLFDVPIEIGLARAGKRGHIDRFESEDRAFFQRVRSAYLEMAQRFPARYRVIDSTLPATRVTTEVEQILKTFCAYS